MSSIFDLEKRINKHKKLSRNKKNKENVAFVTCVEFFSGVFITSIVGYGIDKLIGYKCFFLIMFTVLGFVVGFVNVYRFIMSGTKD